jgi:hypothetical protein
MKDDASRSGNRIYQLITIRMVNRYIFIDLRGTVSSVGKSMCRCER